MSTNPPKNRNIQLRKIKEICKISNCTKFIYKDLQNYFVSLIFYVLKKGVFYERNN